MMSSENKHHSFSSKLKKYSLVYCAILIYTVASMMARMAAKQDTYFMSAVFMMLEVFCLGIYALLWQQVLKIFQLSIAMANKGTNVILTLLFAFFIFDEKITLYNIIGALLVMVGVGMVSADD